MNLDGSFGSFDYNVNGFQDSSNYDYSAMVDSNPSNNYDYTFSPTNLDGYDGFADYESFVNTDGDGKGMASAIDSATTPNTNPDPKDVMRFWSFMHSNWNQYQASRRDYHRGHDGTNPILQPRFYQYHGDDDKFVTNNHRAGGRDLLAGRFDLETSTYVPEGRAGKTLAQMMADGQLGSDLTTLNNIYDKPWELTSEQRYLVHPSLTNHNPPDPMGSKFATEFPFLFDMDLANFDSSWELGYPNNNAQALQRWFEGRNNNPTNANVHNDDTRLRCNSCEVQMKLEWKQNDNGYGGTFVTRHIDAAAMTANRDAWAECTHTETSIPCEFSSGVCFIEERRTWGYVTYLKKGCKQAQACYMQKYQNFLVEAGRQCWPEDNTGMVRTIAARPHDIMADEWIYNILAGGAEAISDSVASYDWADADPRNPASSDNSMQWAATTYDARQFDNTFTDLGPGGNGIVTDANDSNGLTEGLLIDVDYFSITSHTFCVHEHS